MNYRNQLSLLFAAAVAISAASCGGATVEPAADQAATDSTAADSTSDQSTGDSTPAADQSGNLSQTPTVCETITSDDLKAITGIDYAMSNSTANFTTIKHCEYRSEDLKHVVSILVAFGGTGRDRMKNSKDVPKVKPVEDFADEAVWEPAQGVFSALAGDRFVEIQVSDAHGENETRVDLAKSIAKLVLEKY